MVHILLITPKGNMGARFFPYAGYLALTPVTVQGTVSTRLDADNKPLYAKSLSVAVRCYEARHGLRGLVHSNVLAEYPVVLWRAPPDVDSAPLAEFHHSFRITVPRDTPGFSTAYYQDYRVFWRVEVVITHNPIPGVGTRQIKYSELVLLRYDYPSSPPPSPRPPSLLPLHTNKPRAPILNYHLSVPPNPIGPLDLLSIGLSVRPLDPAVSVRSASLTIERRLQIRDTAPTASPPPLSPSPSPNATPITYPSLPYNTSQPMSPITLSPPTSPTLSVPQMYPSTITVNTLHSSYSTQTFNTITSQTPLLPRSASTPATSIPEPAVLATHTHTIAGTESSSGRFVRDPQTGIWTRTLTLQWPAPRSSTRWAIGETMQTDIARVSFWIKVKVVVTGPAGTDSLDLQEHSLLVSSTNDADRQLALSKYHTKLASSPATPNPNPNPSLTVTPASPPTKRNPPSTSRTPFPDAPVLGADRPRKDPDRAGKRKRERGGSSGRPHTSAGPGGARPHTSAEPRKSAPEPTGGAWRPGTAATGGRKSTSSVTAPAPAPIPQLQTTRLNTITGTTTVSPIATPLDVAHVLAWEEELARIEMQSRKSSRLMRAGGKG
ncbi:hypothetical protein DENSPDRAFT_850122 [Dentipellis sp. KUC8613]|nr:hypothetical protein DENSPDRAFT_850122 [Dentipellis sp. KUC8613]